MNTATVERYIDGFNRSDHAQILPCLTADIEWNVFGHFRLQGREAYDREIENPAFTGSPTITITRMVEQADVVMAEMTLETRPTPRPEPGIPSVGLGVEAGAK